MSTKDSPYIDSLDTLMADNGRSLQLLRKQLDIVEAMVGRGAARSVVADANYALGVLYDALVAARKQRT